MSEVGAILVCPWSGEVRRYDGPDDESIKAVQPMRYSDWIDKSLDLRVETRALQRRVVRARRYAERWQVVVYAVDEATAVAAGTKALEDEAGWCFQHTDCLASPELARACWAARTKPPAPSRAGG